MKILIATGIYPPEIGGPATYARILSEELPKRGIEVDVLPFRMVRKYPKVLRHIVYFFKIISSSSGAEIIFTQDPVSTGIPALLAASLTRKKLVLRVAGDYAWEQSRQRYGVKDDIDEFQNKRYGSSVEFLRWLQKFSVRHADVVIAPSRYFSDVVSDWSNGIKEVVTVYNGIDLAFEFKKDAKFPQKTIITAGRLVPWKGFDTLISLLSRLQGWRLLIAGEGPDEARLKELVQKCGVGDRVDFIGNMPRKELFASIYRAHIFALLSTFESFSFQVIEAMHVGIPVIATNIGSLPEIIEDGKDGVLIDPRDDAAFADFVERISTDPGYAGMLSKNAQTKAEKFSRAWMVDLLEEIFNRCVAGGVSLDAK
ncbi:MAG: glycosyltransferase family 4 protein [Candidatus Taylorbacteria bacterium]